MSVRYPYTGQRALQVGERAPTPDNKAVTIREHPGGWYGAGVSHPRHFLAHHHLVTHAMISAIHQTMVRALSALFLWQDLPALHLNGEA